MFCPFKEDAQGIFITPRWEGEFYRTPTFQGMNINDVQGANADMLSTLRVYAKEIFDILSASDLSPERLMMFNQY